MHTERAVSRESPCHRRLSPPLAALAAVAIAVLSAAPVHGRAEPERIRFCFSPWPPYTYTESGQAAGLSIRVLDEAARRAGLAVEYHERPWKRCLAEVRAGTFDAVIDAARRSDFVQGPTSYSVYTNTFWVREDAPIQAFSMPALGGVTVGLVTGYTYPDELVKATPYSIDYSVDDETNLRKLAVGRVDAVVADRVSAMHAADAAGLPLRPLRPTHSSDPLYPSFNEARGAVQRRMYAALAEMRADGYIHAVYAELLGVNFDELVAPSQ